MSEIKKVLLNFGSKEVIVSNASESSAKSDVETLEIQAKFKKKIITGHIKDFKKDEIDVYVEEDRRPDRDFEIYCALIKAEYTYNTIRSIFLNEHLLCSERIREKGGEALLEKEVETALSITKTERLKGKTLEQKAVAFIKAQKKKTQEVILKEVSDYIKLDLLTKEEPAGKGFVDEEKDRVYYFHKEDKTLMDVVEQKIEGEFYYFLRDRYDIPRKDYAEIRDKLVTEIRTYGKRIRAYKFAYFDKENYVLYVSNHNNQIYRLDGERIDIVDNGTDGVFFELSTEFTPFTVDLGEKDVVNYFGGITTEAKFRLKGFGLNIKLGKKRIRGFSPLIFEQEEPYLKRYLVDKANFAPEEKTGFSVENQKDLLVIYFYSLFFETLLTDKPIICFVGCKASGKSTFSAMMGKILFGSKYSNQSLPDNPRDLATVLGDSHLVVFDNVGWVPKNMLNLICACIEATAAKKRMLFTDRTVVSIVPHVFMGFTTIEPKFKRDDVVSRLLLFNTQKVKRVIPKEELYGDIERNRDAIMTEVLVNLNSIVSLLREQREFKPRCSSRLADWEAFGIKVCRQFHWASYFRSVMKRMSEEKDIFTLEDDYVYQALEDIVIKDGEEIDWSSASALYSKLSTRAEKGLEIKDFTKAYKSPKSLANRLSNIEGELNTVMKFEKQRVRGKMWEYRFAPLEESFELVEEKESEEKESEDEIEQLEQRWKTRREYTEEEIAKIAKEEDSD